ncbi:MAG: hypothetical protein ACRDT9_06470 [Agromyces sp.]
MTSPVEYDALDQQRHGTWLLTTESGTIYEIRISGSGVGMVRHPVIDDAAGEEYALYRDKLTIQCEIGPVRLGAPAIIVFVRDDRQDLPRYVATTRITTPVVRILWTTTPQAEGNRDPRGNPAGHRDPPCDTALSRRTSRGGHTVQTSI